MDENKKCKETRNKLKKKIKNGRESVSVELGD